MAPEEMATATELRSLDLQVWKACAGLAARVPAVGSRVYYFPQGHAEQSASPLDLSSVRALVLCRVSSVRLLADPNTEEVFARIHLDPILPTAELHPLSSSFSPPAAGDVAEDGGSGGGLVSFPKTLTRSDANNGGGFSVPRFCADAIFPPLDFAADPPVQNLLVHDVHGRFWNFRHIYRGTPRRHLLTTGWSKFVNEKKLIAGDSVVFMKNAAAELFVGIRRTGRSCGPVDYALCGAPEVAGVKVDEKIGGNDGFSRNARGRILAASVMEAVRSAETNLPFEVVYYPRAGLPEFVVPEEEVETAMRVYWAAGMRVKMSVEVEDSIRATCFQGTVSSVTTSRPGPWPRSPWRMLQVTWDEPEVLQNAIGVNPWQVELVSACTQIQAPFPILKRLRVSQSSDFLGDAEDSMLLDMPEFKSKNFGSLFPSSYSYKTFPAGMQGARHDSTSVPGLLNLIPMSSSQMFSGGLYGINIPEKTKVCTELNIGGNSPSGGSSPPSQESTLDSAPAVLKPLACKPSNKVNRGSFQLFGQVIQIEEPIDNDVDDDHDKQYVGAENAVVSNDFYIHLSSKNLLDTLNDSSQKRFFYRS